MFSEEVHTVMMEEEPVLPDTIEEDEELSTQVEKHSRFTGLIC